VAAGGLSLGGVLVAPAPAQDIVMGGQKEAEQGNGTGERVASYSMATRPRRCGMYETIPKGYWKILWNSFWKGLALMAALMAVCSYFQDNWSSMWVVLTAAPIFMDAPKRSVWYFRRTVLIGPVILLIVCLIVLLGGVSPENTNPWWLLSGGLIAIGLTVYSFRDWRNYLRGREDDLIISFYEDAPAAPMRAAADLAMKLENAFLQGCQDSIRRIFKAIDPDLDIPGDAMVPLLSETRAFCTEKTGSKLDRSWVDLYHRTIIALERDTSWSAEDVEDAKDTLLGRSKA